MRALADSPSSIAEELSGAANVLLLTPTMGAEEGAVCSSLLSAVPDERADVLSVTFNESPDDQRERWRRDGGPTEPANLGFVVVGGDVRSAAAVQAPTDGPTIGDVGPTVTTVSSPGDLTGIGIELGHFFEDWADDGNALVLCFRSLTTFLQYADLRSVYRFVHVLTGRVRNAGGLAHFHLDPSAHDQRTINTLQGLFDAVVEPDADGRWAVKRRR